MVRCNDVGAPEEEQSRYKTECRGDGDRYTTKKKKTFASGSLQNTARLFGAFVLLRTRSSAIAEGPRDASCQLKSCQLPRNSAETTYTTSPDQIDGVKLEI